MTRHYTIDGSIRTFLLATMVFFCVQAKAIVLSDSSRLSLLTCSPGDELYSCFGHSAIRVTDFRQGFDLVFNYGTFDFDQPDFYLNFVRGHMIYMLGVDQFQDFNYQYQLEHRNIYEQEINIDAKNRGLIFDFLVNNAKEQNRNYRYDFLFDNCATRIRDVFEKNIKNITFDYSSFTEKKSFRDLINDYSSQAPWSQFGMNLLIGLPVDCRATPAQMCFLPDYLSRGFDHATISGRPLCHKAVQILFIPPVEHTVSLIDRITPTIVFGLLLILFLIIGYIEFKTQTHLYGIDIILFFVVGILGTLFLLIGTCTEHTTTQWNLNIIWALPTHLIIVFVLLFQRHKKWVLNYFLFTAIISMMMIVSWKIIPQKFLYANILIATIMAIRSYSIYTAPKPIA